MVLNKTKAPSSAASPLGVAIYYQKSIGSYHGYPCPRLGDFEREPGVTTDPAAEIKRLQREKAGLRKANENLKAASVFFAKDLDRPWARWSGA